MINKVILIGRLIRDPDMRSTLSGISSCSFTLAVERSFTNQQGEKEADFIPIVAWRKLAETCGKYLAKGRLVAVVGRIQTRNYEDKNGQKRYVTEIIADEVQFLEWGEKQSTAPATQDTSGAPQGFEPVENDGDLPF